MKYAEGLVQVQVPDRSKLSSDNPVFLNEEKKFDRDVNVLLIKALNWSGKTYLETMSASGIRGLRVEKETNAFDKIILNDKDEEVVKNARENLERNNVDAEVHKSRAKRLLINLNHGVDYVDVDPYGSSIYYISDATRILSRGGVLSITNTDTAALSGTYPTTCERRYGSRSYKSEFYYESGLRILAKSAIMNSAKYDVGLEPIFAHATRHYFRIYFKKLKGARVTDELVKKIDYISYCPKCLHRQIGYSKECSNCNGLNIQIGPLYTGSVYDTELIKDMLKFGEYEEFLNKTLEECEANVPWFYTTSRIAKKYKIPEPRMNDLPYARTHINPKGFKTSEGIKEIIKRFKKKK